MFGFMFGTACLVGLAFTLSHGRHRGHFRRRGFRHGLRFLFRRLDTTPGQEKVIRSAVDDVLGQGRELRRELERTRSEVASQLRGEVLEPDALASALIRNDEALADLRRSIAANLTEIHEVLDSRQREILADTLQRGPRRWRGDAYRTAP